MMTELYAATGDGFARIRDHGDDWHVSLSLAGGGIQCLALDPLRPGIVYAGSSGSGLWRSPDRSTSWEKLDFPQPDVFSVAVSPVDGTIYAGCEPSMLFRSRDEGRTWTEMESLRRLPSAPTWSFPPRPWTSHVRWIAPSPHQAGVVLVGIELGGLMYSGDAGET